jgi:hypothetical protein
MGCSLCKVVEDKEYEIERRKKDRIIETRLNNYEDKLNSTINAFSMIVEYLDRTSNYSSETDKEFERRIRLRRRDGPVFGVKALYDAECDRAERMREIYKELNMFCRENR